MKIDEAIEILNQFKEESQKHKDNYTPIGTSNLSPVLKIMQDTYQENIDAFDMAIEALEKQIPVQAIREETADNFMCPTCKKVYEDWWEFNVCQNCGQFFDWPEQEV